MSGGLFLLRHRLATSSGVHPASYLVDTSPRVKQPGREADHLSRSSDEAENVWIYTSTPHISLWRAV